MSCKYSSPAMEPAPNVPVSIAFAKGFCLPGFTLALTK
jgi:hypothetical protein